LDLESERERMLRDIEAEARLTRPWTGRERLDPRVMQAMAAVPRHEFVPPHLRHQSYDNGPLPIGHGQTISQPFIVALMTDLLDLPPDAVVLDVGTGSGYQAAVLAQLARQVYGIETIGELAEAAGQRLAQLGYDNVEVAGGDGCDGWAQHAPYDGIIVAAAVPAVPAALVEQLKPGGKLVLPVDSDGAQDLRQLVRQDDGSATVHSILPVVFVPLVGRCRERH